MHIHLHAHICVPVRTPNANSHLVVMLHAHPALQIRINELHWISGLYGIVSKQTVKLDAWVAKKCCVLVKRKLQRGQAPRARGFRNLMAAVFPERFQDDDGGDDADDGADDESQGLSEEDRWFQTAIFQFFLRKASPRRIILKCLYQKGSRLFSSLTGDKQSGDGCSFR